MIGREARGLYERGELAAQMRMAFDAAQRPARTPSYEMIHRLHQTPRWPL